MAGNAWLRAWGDAWVQGRCAACRAPLFPGGRGFCAPCEETITPANAAHGVFAFSGALKTTIRNAKFRPDEAAARLLMECIRLAPIGDVDGIDAVSYVPVHRRRLLKRGFDLSALLAASIADRYSLPLLEALRCVRFDPPRALGERRRKSVQGKFVATPAAHGRVLLVDDVLTTGETMNEAVRVLTEAGVDATPLAFAVAAPPRAP